MADRERVRAAFLAFARGFSERAPHDAKVERYVDVLADLPIDHLEAGLSALKGVHTLPAPGKIREAVVLARIRREMQEEAARRKAELERLADPRVRAEIRGTLAEQAGSLIDCEDILDELVEDAHGLGLVGEDVAAKLVYLSFHTRHFRLPQRPVSMVLKGTSSAGKSFTVKCALRFVAPGSVVEMSGMSPKWLAYASAEGLDFSHKFLFVHEASGIEEEVERMLRVLLSEGRIIWRTVIDQQPHTLVVEGPTGLVETTTSLALHWENETRLLSIPVDESKEQTRRVLERIGQGATEEPNLTRWHALDSWIALGPRDVVIPFQGVIGDLAKPVAPRVRRDVTTLLGLVRAHALLNEAKREIDANGRVVATLDDYRIVHELTADLFASAVELKVSETVRDVVQAAAAIVSEKIDAGREGLALSAEIERRIGKDRSSTNRWIEVALKAEFLEDASARQGQGIPRHLRMGGRALPAEGAKVFPSPEEVAERFEGAAGRGVSAQVRKLPQPDLRTYALARPAGGQVEG